MIVALLMIRVGPRPVRRRQGSAVSEIREAAAFALAHPPIRDLLVLLGVVSVVGMPYTVLMPVFADRVLGGGRGRWGCCWAPPASARRSWRSPSCAPCPSPASPSCSRASA